MSALTPISINGVTYTYKTSNAEYTSGDVAEAYAADMQVFSDLFGLQATSTQSVQDQINAGNYGPQIYKAYHDLLTLVNNGLPSTSAVNGEVVTSTYYLTDQMAQSADVILKTLNAAGLLSAPVPADPLTATSDQIAASKAIWDPLIAQWKTVVANSTIVQSALSQAVNSITGNRSLQALVELIYVSSGSDYISSNLASLQQALQVTNSALADLATFQNLHNKITVNGVVLASAATVKNNFAVNGSTYFGNVYPSLPASLSSPNASGVNQFFTDIAKVRDSFIAEISQLTPLSDSTDPNTLLANLKTLVNGLNALSGFSRNSTNAAGSAIKVPLTAASLIANKTKTTNSSFGGLKTWVLDGYATANNSNAGAIQNQITTAITAGQSLNSENQQNVRNYLYVFEEFYKSASAMLTSITQIIQKMAQNIKG